MKSNLSPKKTADALVFQGKGDELQLLVIKRKNPPFQGKMALPGGFIDESDPSPLEAAIRELKEETGLDLSGSSGIPLIERKIEGRDPRGETHTYPFLFHLEKEVSVRGLDDAEEAMWVPILELGALAFDHGAILCEAISLYWPFFNGDSSKSSKIPGQFRPKSVTDNPEEVTFYGGSFNPWHKGHMECLNLCPNQNIIVVPDHSPFKKQSSLKQGFCYWESYKGLALLLKDTPYSIFPGFWGKENPNPTSHWIKNLKDPPEKISFLMGMDSFLSLPRWHRPEELLNVLDKLWVVPRDVKNGKKTEEVKIWVNEKCPGVELTILPGHQYEKLSSTKIRTGED